MSRFTTVPLFTLLTLLIASPAAAQEKTPKVAIANAARIFSEIQEVKDLRTKMDSQRKTVEAQKLERQQKLRDLENARNALKPDAPTFAEKNRELLQAAIEYQVWERMATADTDREQKTQMLSIFNKITATIAEVATQKQVDIVIAEQRPDLPDATALEQLNMDQVRALIISRNVLFATSSVDVTNDVIASMDAKYKAGQ